jgi:hypothetical protein
LKSLEELYKVYDFDSFFNLRLYYNNKSVKGDAWLNYSAILIYITFTALVLEFLQVIRHFIAINGIKMKRGLGFKLKIVFSILPILSIILYISEAIIVFGYSGETCFCQY